MPRTGLAMVLLPFLSHHPISFLFPSFDVNGGVMDVDPGCCE